MNPPKVTLTVKLSLIGCALPLIYAFTSCGGALCATITTWEGRRSTTTSISDRFGNAVERGANSVSLRVFRPEIKPVDISSMIRRSMDDPVKELSPEHTIAANHFVVYATRSDFASLEAGLEILASEFALQTTEHATVSGCVLLDPVHIDFAVDNAEQTGQLRAESSNRRGPAAPATASSPSPAHPIIDVDGERWLLIESITVIGRGTEADVVINDSGVSRRHLELRITPTGVIITDPGSTNDTFIEGHKIDVATLFDGNQIVIGRTPVDFWIYPDSDGGQ